MESWGIVASYSIHFVEKWAGQWPRQSTILTGSVPATAYLIYIISLYQCFGVFKVHCECVWPLQPTLYLLVFLTSRLAFLGYSINVSSQIKIADQYHPLSLLYIPQWTMTVNIIRWSEMHCISDEASSSMYFMCISMYSCVFQWISSILPGWLYNNTAELFYKNMFLFLVAQLVYSTFSVHCIGHLVHSLLAHEVFRRFVSSFCISGFAKSHFADSAVSFSATHIVSLQSKVLGRVFPHQQLYAS